MAILICLSWYVACIYTPCNNTYIIFIIAQSYLYEIFNYNTIIVILCLFKEFR
jgi:hypothetical protein